MLAHLTVATILLLAGLQLADIVGQAQISILDLGQIVLTPVVTLTGTALGFYYGAQSAAGRGDAGSKGWPPTRSPGTLRKFLRWLW